MVEKQSFRHSHRGNEIPIHGIWHDGKAVNSKFNVRRRKPSFVLAPARHRRNFQLHEQRTPSSSFASSGGNECAYLSSRWQQTPSCIMYISRLSWKSESLGGSPIRTTKIPTVRTITNKGDTAAFKYAWRKIKDKTTLKPVQIKSGQGGSLELRRHPTAALLFPILRVLFKKGQYGLNMMVG